MVTLDASFSHSPEGAYKQSVLMARTDRPAIRHDESGVVEILLFSFDMN